MWREFLGWAERVWACYRPLFTRFFSLHIFFFCFVLDKEASFKFRFIKCISMRRCKTLRGCLVEEFE